MAGLDAWQHIDELLAQLAAELSSSRTRDGAMDMEDSSCSAGQARLEWTL